MSARRVRSHGRAPRPAKPSEQDGLHQLLRRLETVIEAHGHAVLSIGASETTPNYSYTVGLAAAGLPELLLMGIEPEVAQPLLNRVAARLRAGEKIEAGDELTEVASVTLRLVELPAPAVALHLRVANLRDNGALRALQVVWPDAAGRWPWQWDDGDEGLLLGTVPEKWQERGA